MTKKELAKAMYEFIESQDSNKKDEWYCTDRCLADQFIREFAEFIDIELPE